MARKAKAKQHHNSGVAALMSKALQRLGTKCGTKQQLINEGLRRKRGMEPLACRAEPCSATGDRWSCCLCLGVRPSDSDGRESTEGSVQQLLLLLNKKESKGRDNRHSGSGGVDIGSGSRPEN